MLVKNSPKLFASWWSSEDKGRPANFDIFKIDLLALCRSHWPNQEVLYDLHWLPVFYRVVLSYPQCYLYRILSYLQSRSQRLRSFWSASRTNPFHWLRVTQALGTRLLLLRPCLTCHLANLATLAIYVVSTRENDLSLAHSLLVSIKSCSAYSLRSNYTIVWERLKGWGNFRR